MKLNLYSDRDGNVIVVEENGVTFSYTPHEKITITVEDFCGNETLSCELSLIELHELLRRSLVRVK